MACIRMHVAFQLARLLGAMASIAAVGPCQQVGIGQISYQCLLLMLYGLGCKVPGHPQPTHGVARISLEFKALAALLMQQREFQGIEAWLLDVKAEVQSGERSTLAGTRVREVFIALQVPNWIIAEYVQLDETNSGAILRFLDLLSEHLESRFENELAPQIRRAFESFPLTVNVVGTTSDLFKLARYSARSCHEQNGMWSDDIDEIRSKKMKQVIAMLGVLPESTVLYLGTGCGEPLHEFASVGAYTVGQELFQPNLDFLAAKYPDWPLCGGDAGHFLFSLPAGVFDYVVANSLLHDVVPKRRCTLLKESLRVARKAVYIGWNSFNASEWQACGRNDLHIVSEYETFGAVEYGSETHSVFAPWPVHNPNANYAAQSKA